MLVFYFSPSYNMICKPSDYGLIIGGNDDLSHNILQDATESGMLWIGSINAATDEQFLTKHKINFIVDASNSQYELPRAAYRLRNWSDAEISSADPHVMAKFENLCAVVRGAAQIINQKLIAGYNVLVNCMAGVNRSATIISTYLILYRNENPVEVYMKLAMINKGRGLPVLTNDTFRRLLQHIYNSHVARNKRCESDNIDAYLNMPQVKQER
jgi:protein-tyrosine phosphatase